MDEFLIGRYMFSPKSVMSKRLNPERTRFALPILATAVLAVLFLHQSSDSPTILSRYSVGYVVMLLLAGLNVILLWRRPPVPALRTAISAMVLMSSGAVLIDFLSGLEWITVDPFLVSTFLVIGISIQTGIFDRVRTGLTGLPWISLHELALLAFSLMFAVLLGEVGLRLFLLERLTPKTLGEFQTFMAGRWPRPIAVEKDSSTVRIAGLADSMGVVGGPEENYYYVLENLLRKSGVSAEMMNVSVSGNSPVHELAMLEHAMAYKPDLVLQSFYVGNDFTLYGENTYQVRAVRFDEEPGKNRFVPENFFLVDFVRNWSVSVADVRLREEEGRLGQVEKVGHLSRRAYFALEQSRFPLFRPSQRESMSEVFQVLDATRELAIRGGARYAMVINPEHIQIDDKLRAEVLRTFNMSSDQLDFEFPQQIMRDYCQSRGIQCLDLLPIFKATKRGGGLYTIRDGHYSRDGNQTAADAIHEFVIANGLTSTR